ncbi:unnamed protein product [Tilletia caries]|nr:unnamed protein product [Tilletia caries]
MEQQRRIHQHAHKLARPANRRIPSAHHSRDLVAHSPASPLNPRLIFGPIDNGDSSTGSGGGGKGGGGGGGSGSNSGTGTGGNSPSHPGSSSGKPDPHSGDDPTTGSGDDSGDNSGTGKDPVTTSKSTPKPTQTSTSTPTQTPTPTATKTTPTATTTNGPAFTFVVPSQSTAYVQVQPTTSTATLDNPSGTGENADASTGSSRAGPIIGIVAGVLVGIALISVIASFVFRKVKAANEDPYESDPFDGSEYQRHNETLPADNFSEDDHRAAAAGMGGMQSPDMTERTLANVGGQGGIGSPYLDQGPAMMGMGMGIGAAAGAYDNASITSASRNQSGGPRPPTMFARHLEAHSGSAAAAAPPQVGGVYAPGEYTHAVVPAMPPTAATYNGAGSDPSMSPFMGPGVVMGHANVSSPYAHLDRARSTSSQYVDLDRSASGSSAGGGAPPPGGEYNRRSRQGVLDSMAEEGSGQEQYSQQQAAYAQQQQQQQAYYNAGQAQQHDPYQQQQYQQQQYQGQHQQHPAQRAPSPDDDPYGGVY